MRYDLFRTLPAKGDTGGVEPAGETGGESFWLSCGGFTIIMLLVTLTASSAASSPNDLRILLAPSDSAIPNYNTLVPIQTLRSWFYLTEIDKIQQNPNLIRSNPIIYSSIHD